MREVTAFAKTVAVHFKKCLHHNDLFLLAGVKVSFCAFALICAKKFNRSFKYCGP